MPFLLTLFSTIAFFLCYLFYVRVFKRVSSTIPYAGEESILARLKVAEQYNADPVKFLVEQRKKLGDVFCVDLLLFKVVYFFGADGNKAILRASDEDLSFWDFIKAFIGPFSGPNYIWRLDWMEQAEKLMRLGLSGTEILQTYASTCDGIAEEIFETWSDTPDGVISLFEGFSDLIYAYVFTIFVGKPFYLEHAKEARILMTKVLEALQDPLLQALPSNVWWLTPTGRRGFRAQHQLREYIRAAALQAYEDKKKGLPMDDSYLGFLCKHSTEKYISHFTYHVQMMMFAAHANIANTLPWLFLHANNVPGCVERCRAEMKTEEVHGGRGIRPYLEACFRETGRLYSGSTTFRRVSRSHPKGYTTILGHRVPCGTFVACSPVVTQQDPLVFEEPDKWNPERFLEKDGERYREWSKRMEFLQFGAGAHACLGEKMTRTILLNDIMEVWLRKYDIQVVEGLQEGIGYDGVGVVPAWLKGANGTPPCLGEDILVKVVKIA